MNQERLNTLNDNFHLLEYDDGRGGGGKSCVIAWYGTGNKSEAEKKLRKLMRGWECSEREWNCWEFCR